MSKKPKKPTHKDTLGNSGVAPTPPTNQPTGEERGSGSPLEEGVTWEMFVQVTASLSAGRVPVEDLHAILLGKAPKAPEFFEKTAREALLLIEACQSVWESALEEKERVARLQPYTDETLVPFLDARRQIMGMQDNGNMRAKFEGCLQKYYPEQIANLGKWQESGVPAKWIARLKPCAAAFRKRKNTRFTANFYRTRS